RQDTHRASVSWLREVPGGADVHRSDWRDDRPLDRCAICRRAIVGGGAASAEYLQRRGAPGRGRPRSGRANRTVAPMPRLGAHMSIAGGLPRAVERAVVHGCEAMQIFAKNASQWRGRVLSPEEARD